MEELIIKDDSDQEIDDEDEEDADGDIFKMNETGKENSQSINNNININSTRGLEIKFSNDNSMLKEADDIINTEKWHDHADNISEVPVMEESFNDTKSIKQNLEGIVFKGENLDKIAKDQFNLNVKNDNNS